MKNLEIVSTNSEIIILIEDACFNLSSAQKSINNLKNGYNKQELMKYLSDVTLELAEEMKDNYDKISEIK